MVGWLGGRLGGLLEGWSVGRHLRHCREQLISAGRLLIDMKAGIGHLAEKLHVVKLDGEAMVDPNAPGLRWCLPEGSLCLRQKQMATVNPWSLAQCKSPSLAWHVVLYV